MPRSTDVGSSQDVREAPATRIERRDVTTRAKVKPRERIASTSNVNEKVSPAGMSVSETNGPYFFSPSLRRLLLSLNHLVRVIPFSFLPSRPKSVTMLALDIVNVTATVTTIVLLFSPFPDFRQIHTQKNTGEVRVLPVLMLGVNCYTWSMYGLLSGTYFPVMSINAFGALTSLAFTLVFYRYSSDRVILHRMGAIAGAWVLLVLLFAVLCKTDVIPLASNAQEKVVGYVAVIINVALYASPLQTMKLVLQTKSAASLPATMCCVNLVNGSLWVLYGILANDMFVLTPNALGVVLSAVQVVLCLKFRPNGRVVEAHDAIVMDTTKCVSPLPIDVVKSPVYQAAQSPV